MMKDAFILIILVVSLFVIGYLLAAVNKYSKDRDRKREVAKRRRVTPKLKQMIMERDNYTCQICGISKGFCDELYPGLGEYLLLEIDHIKSIANGGTSDPENLQTLCWKCNRIKGSQKTNRQVQNIIKNR